MSPSPVGLGTRTPWMDNAHVYGLKRTFSTVQRTRSLSDSWFSSTPRSSGGMARPASTPHATTMPTMVYVQRRTRRKAHHAFPRDATAAGDHFDALFSGFALIPAPCSRIDDSANTIEQLRLHEKRCAPQRGATLPPPPLYSLPAPMWTMWSCHDAVWRNRHTADHADQADQAGQRIRRIRQAGWLRTQKNATGSPSSDSAGATVAYRGAPHAYAAAPPPP